MNCFYCDRPIVDGHCANHCAEKRQVEQGHIDQEYQRKLIGSIPTKKGLSGMTIILLCEVAFIAALLAIFIHGCTPETVTPIIGVYELPTKPRGVAATVKWDRNETGINRGVSVESFAGRDGLQPVSNVENRDVSAELSAPIPKTGYEPVQDNRLVPRPSL